MFCISFVLIISCSTTMRAINENIVMWESTKNSLLCQWGRRNLLNVCVCVSSIKWIPLAASKTVCGKYNILKIVKKCGWGCPYRWFLKLKWSWFIYLVQFYFVPFKYLKHSSKSFMKVFSLPQYHNPISTFRLGRVVYWKIFITLSFRCNDNWLRLA